MVESNLPSLPMARMALISNSGSGSGSANEVEAMLADHGAEVACFEIGALAEAAAVQPERYVVAGGDGSIAPVAAQAARTGVPLAVIAAGTANDFAVRMGLPEDLDQAAALAAAGEKIRRIDLGWVGPRAFVNVASFGLAPRAAEEAEASKERLGAASYAIGAAKAAMQGEPVELVVRCGERRLHQGPAWQVIIAASGAFGGGSQIDADDGMLDAVIVEGSSKLRLPQRAIGMKMGTLEAQEGVSSHRCPEVEVEVDPDEQLNCDGEVVPAAEVGSEGVVRFSIEVRAVELVIG